MCVQSLGQADSLEESMATCSSILAWRIPWTEEPGGLQIMGTKKNVMSEHSHLPHQIVLTLSYRSFQI